MRAWYLGHPPQIITELPDELGTARFEKGDRKNTGAEKPKAAIDRTLAKMIEVNRIRIDFREKFDQVVVDYNAGSKNVSAIFERMSPTT